MSENKLISVIVPVYKVENYLDECVASIVKQTYRNIEIILVDDGSPDNCPKMCDEWAKKDDRVKVIHKANGGVSSARNVGIEQAQGEYICFVDSDDYILEDYCEKMLNEMNKHNADIVICDLLDNGVPEYKLISTLVLDMANKDNFIDVYKNYQFLSPVNKLFKKDLIKTKFPVGVKYGEDEIFNLAYFDNVAKVAVIPDALYFYRYNPQSVTHENSEKLLIERAKNTKNKFTLLNSILKDESLAKYYATYMTIYNIQKYIHEMQTQKIKSKEIENVIEKIMANADVYYTVQLYKYGFSKNNDYFCKILKKGQYNKICNYIKINIF